MKRFTMTNVKNNESVTYIIYDNETTDIFTDDDFDTRMNTPENVNQFIMDAMNNLINQGCIIEHMEF